MAFHSLFTVLECSSFLQQSRCSVVCVSCTHVCSHRRWNGWSHLTSGSTHSIKTRSKISLFWRNAEHGAGGKSWFASSHSVFEKVISCRPLNKKAEDVPVHYYMAVSHKDWELPNPPTWLCSFTAGHPSLCASIQLSPVLLFPFRSSHCLGLVLQ